MASTTEAFIGLTCHSALAQLMPALHGSRLPVLLVRQLRAAQRTLASAHGPRALASAQSSLTAHGFVHADVIQHALDGWIGLSIRDTFIGAGSNGWVFMGTLFLGLKLSAA